MTNWWEGLSRVNQGFYCAAAFFSVFFVWQLISALVGLGGDDGDVDADGDLHADADVDVDHTYHNFEHGAESDAAATVASFKLLSIRSILTFFTLFAWGVALYLNRGDALSKAMGISVLWGLAGMLSVALIFFFMKKMAHTGTRDLDTCVGTEGSVYLNIPGDGTGEVRVRVSGSVAFIKARSANGGDLRAGTPIRVVGRSGPNAVSVEPVSPETAA